MTKYVGSSILVAVKLINFPFSLQLRDQIRALQALLTQRPPIEAIQELRKEYSNLELILQGTQRENERAMTELERFVLTCHPCQIDAHQRTHCNPGLNRGRQREKLLERELEKLAGSNWQVRVRATLILGRKRPLTPCPAPYPTPAQANLEIAPTGVSSPLSSRTITTPFSPPMPYMTSQPPAGGTSKASVEETMAQVEQVRLLVLGMEERLRVREEKLVKTMETADQESHRFEVLRKDLVPSKS